MKDFLRESLIWSISLYAAAAIFSGLKLSGGAVNLLMSGLVFALFHHLVKPLIKLITLPLNLLTLGLLNWINQVIILALIVKVWRHVAVAAFTIPAWQQSGFSIPSLYINSLVSYILAAVILTLIYKIVDWLCQY